MLPVLVWKRLEKVSRLSSRQRVNSSWDTVGDAILIVRRHFSCVIELRRAPDAPLHGLWSAESLFWNCERSADLHFTIRTPAAYHKLATDAISWLHNDVRTSLYGLWPGNLEATWILFHM